MTTDTPTPSGAPVDLPVCAADGAPFDIVQTYHDLLAQNRDLTKPVVAIKALISLLENTNSVTAHETMDVLQASADRLTNSVRNPVPLVAGTHLFLWFVRQMLRDEGGNFENVRRHLVDNGQVFAQRAIHARTGVAEHGFRVIKPGQTVMTHGSSRAVLGLIERAQQAIPGRFKVIYVRDHYNPRESERVVSRLRKLGIPTAPIDGASVLTAVKAAKPGVSAVFLGGEVITKGGGVISRVGAAQVAQIAHESSIPVFVCGEEHKFVAFMPWWNEIGFDQKLLDFGTEDAERPTTEDPVEWVVSLPPFLVVDDDFEHTLTTAQPHDYVHQLITERGLHLPNHVSTTIYQTYGSFDG